MKTTSYYPVLLSADVARAAEFYITHFRFQALYQADWYIHLQSLDDPSVNLGLVAKDHATIPEAGRGLRCPLLRVSGRDDLAGIQTTHA